MDSVDITDGLSSDLTQRVLPNRKKFNHHLLIFGFGLLSCGVLVFVIYLMSDVPFGLHPHSIGSAFDAAAGLFTLWTSILVFFWLSHHHFDWFDIAVWFSINTLAQVVLNVWLLQRNYEYSSPWLNSRNLESAAIHTLVIMAISLTVLWISYAISTGLIAKHPPQIVKENAPWHINLPLVFGIWVITWLINFYTVVAGQQGYLSTATSIWANYLYLISLLSDLCAFILLLQHFKSPTWQGWIWVSFLVVAEIGISFIVGTKSGIFIFLYVLVARYYIKRNIPWTRLVVGVFVMLIIIPTVNVFRVSLFESGFDRDRGAGFAERIPILYESLQQVLFNTDFSDLLDISRKTFEDRQGSVFEVSMAMSVVHPDPFPFQIDELISATAETLIPRVFWWDKPTERSSLYAISTIYLGARQENSFAITGQFLDAYRYGGFPFVVVYFSLMGFVFAWLYALGPKHHNIIGIAFYLLIMINIWTYESTVMWTMLRTLQFGIPLYLLSRYVFINRRHA